jgi:hypothetical protein
MFCPNCASANDANQNYCRTCGLKLDAIAAELAEQRPSTEYADIQRKRQRFELLGLAALSIFGLIAVMLILSRAFYEKLVFFGPGPLFWSAFVAMMLFGLLSVFFFNYPKMFMNIDKLNPRLPPAPKAAASGAPTTKKLLEDKPFHPVPSVTEDSTELLHVDARTKKLG